jgi:lactoylglutathione lyase
MANYETISTDVILDEFACKTVRPNDIASLTPKAVGNKGVSMVDEIAGERIAEMPSLSLIVLRVRDLAQARAFYRLLGLSFVDEQHGSGPLHYSATIDGLTLELYPARPEDSLGRQRLGFRVRPLDGIVESLRRQGVKIVSEVRESPWGRRAIVEDPEGNVIELTGS